MSERKEQLKQLYKLLALILFAFLYAWGGIEHKWLRRFIAPLVLGASIWFSSKDWKASLQSLFLMVTLSLGYGGTTLIEKIGRRALFGAMNGITPLWMLFKSKGWIVYFYNIALCVTAYIVFGVWNPFGSARIEETVLGLTVGFLSIMSAKQEEE